MAREHVTGELLPPAGASSFPIPPPPPRQARQLTGPQFQAAVADAAGMARKDIAKLVRVSESTIKTWREFPEYQHEVERLQDTHAEMVAEPIAKMREELVGGVRAAIRALMVNLDAADEKGRPRHSVRKEAAELLLRHGIELHKEMLRRSAQEPAAQTTQAVQVVINTGDGPPDTSGLQ